MTVEAATTINQLIVTLPADTDPVAEGKNHLRLLKSTLLNTFPSVTGVVTASQADLNSTTGLAATVTALAASSVQKTGAQTMAGPLTVTGETDVGSLKVGGVSWPFSGCIVLWAGTASTIPSGWALCDGTNGTPNLGEQFVIGAATALPVGSTGGFLGATVTTDSQGLHSHTAATGAAGSHTHTIVTDTQGSHAHGGTDGAYALTVNDLPPHTHSHEWITAQVSSGGTFAGSGNGYPQAVDQTGSTGGGAAHSHPITTDGAHAHGGSTNAATTHTHTISSDGTHYHTLSVPTVPPYFALCYIMKL